LLLRVKRSFFGFINQIGCCTGFLLVTVLGAAVSWRQTSFICSVPSIVIALTGFFIPEKEVEASNISIGEICQYKKELLFGFIFMFFLQFVGISAVLSNIESIIRSANLTVSAGLVGILTNVVQLITTIIASFIVDKIGNRICWTVASVLQLIAFIFLCLHQVLGWPSGVFIAALFVEQIGYGIGSGPIPFPATAELFVPEVRATGMAISTGENWILAAVVCLIWPYLQEALTLGYAFLFFAGIHVIAIIFGLLFFKPKHKQVEAESSESSTSSASQKDSDKKDSSEAKKDVSHAKNSSSEGINNSKEDNPAAP
jgi:hypothetical protein